MASIKLVLRKKENKDGTFPLAIRITKDRKTSFIHLGYSLNQKDWDEKLQKVKKNHANSVRLNNFLLKKLAEASNASIELETEKSDVSSLAVKHKVKPSNKTTFFAVADLYIEYLRNSGKYNQYTADKSRLNNFRTYINNSSISFADITVALLEKFKVHLKATMDISERTIINHMVVIRSVFSYARKNEIIDRKYYPFGEGRVRIKFPDSLKIGLTSEEVKQLEDSVFPINSNEVHAKNLWLFSFYLAGMRISDVLRLRWSDIQNNRLYYAMGKNAKGGSLKLPQKAIDIIMQYREIRNAKDDYIFPELKKHYDSNDKFNLERSIAFATSRIDKILRNHVAPKAGVEKKLTMHIARHTFGNISGDRIQIQMLQKLYRHSSIVTTIGYQANFIHRDADEALEAVIN